MKDFGSMIFRLIALSLAIFQIAHGADAEELDFPRRPGVSYSVANLNEYACLHGDLVRVTYVEYLGGPGRAPCTVVYKKRPPEKPSQEFLWWAKSDAGFCESKARLLIGKLRAAGWKCGLYRDVFGDGQ